MRLQDLVQNQIQKCNHSNAEKNNYADNIDDEKSKPTQINDANSKGID